MRTLHTILIAAVALAAPCDRVSAIDFTTLDFPGADYTELTGIDGNNMVGWYQAADGAQHAFLYDGAAWTTLDVPFPQNPPDPFLLAYGTRAFGISGDKIVGWYLPGPHGFLFEGGFGGGVWTPLDYPGNLSGSNQAVDGNRIVGTGDRGGFLYDGSEWSLLAYPGSVWTNPIGIDGERIVGFYQAEDVFAPRHGFVYDGVDWTPLDYPGSVQTEIHGIDGNRLVGMWWDDTQSHGLIYDGLTWQSFDYPGSIGTVAYDISGDRIVGIYFDQTGNSHNFLATIPEPGGMTLAALALVFAALRRSPARMWGVWH